MNKTVNINLAGIFFHIDEDAYLKLSRYLEAIKRSFTDSQGRSEIISDIEARIAELFSERIQNEKHVVGITLVDEVITIMGQPEDYLVDDEIFEDEPYSQPSKTSQRSTKKLFRDTENSYIGGVSAGLAHYLGIDIIWVRLLWVLFAFMSGGTFIIIYLIFWALVPEAKTTAEKLTMTGEAITISNIEKKIKDGIDTFTNTVKNVDLKKHGETIKEGFEHVADNISQTVKQVDFEKQGNKLKNTSRNFFETVGDIIVFFLKVFVKFFGVILIITGVSTLLGLIIAFFTIGVTDIIHLPGMAVFEAGNVTNTPIWLISLLVFLAVGIPFFFIFYIGLKILINNLKSIGIPAKFTLLGVWVVAIIGLAITGIKQASEYAYSDTVKIKNSIPITAKDTLYVSMTIEDDYRGRKASSVVREGNSTVLKIDDVRLIVRSTTDTTGRIELIKSANGSSYDVARERAEEINYSYTLTDNRLVLDRYLSTDIKNKFREQEIDILLYLPEGATLFADNNTYKYHRNYDYHRDILDNGMEEHYLTIIEGNVLCNDCDTTEVKPSPSHNKTTKAKTNRKKAQDSIAVNNNNDVQVKINDEDGVKITIQKRNQNN